MTRKCIEQLQLEDEKIARTIDAAIRELFTKLAGKKLTAEDDHSEAIPPRQFYRIRSFQHLLESRVGSHDDIRIAREQVLQYWPSLPEERLGASPAEANSHLPSVADLAAYSNEVLSAKEPVAQSPDAIEAVEPVASGERPEKAAVLEAGPDAISEPEFETKAADVRQEAPAEIVGTLIAPATRKAKPPTGYALHDEPLVREIIELRKTNQTASLWEAAQQVADRAMGKGTLENRARRLHRRAIAEWRRLYGEIDEA